MSIDVIVSCYEDQVKRLDECLNSINNQTFLPENVIVSHTNDTNIDITNYKFKVQFVKSENPSNPAKLRNLGANLSKSEILCFIDSDDNMHPQKLELVKKCFENPEIVCFLHGFKIYYKQEHDVLSHTNFDLGRIDLKGYHIEDTQRKCFPVCSHVSVRRDLYEVIRFDESDTKIGCDDLFFCKEIVTRYKDKVAFSDQKLGMYANKIICGFDENTIPGIIRMLEQQDTREQKIAEIRKKFNPKRKIKIRYT